MMKTNRFRFWTRTGRVIIATALATIPAIPILISGCNGGGSSNPPVLHQTNLVADTDGVANITDPNLVNPWGIGFSPTGPFWISDNRTGLSTVYNSSGMPFPSPTPIVVTIPAPDMPTGGTPSGLVFNNTSDFVISGSGNPALFIFATEDGTIAAWNISQGTSAVIVADNSDNAVYKGIAIGKNASGNFLFATNFALGQIDVYDTNFLEVTQEGTFTDPTIPEGFAPFGIANINGKLYVTYALQDAEHHHDVAGLGNGFIRVFDTNGNLVLRLASQGDLNSPWGLAIAPSDFDSLSGALLVGNFGDGHINAFNNSGQFLGQLAGPNGTIAIDGLWGLIVGNGGLGGDSGTLYFTAGPDMENHGLFGSLHP